MNWIGNFTSRNNESFTITIVDDSLSTNKTLQLVPDSIVLDYDLNGFNNSAISTSLSFSVITDEDIISIFSNECFVTLTKGSDIVWSGNVSPTESDMPRSGYRDTVEVTCVDFMSKLLSARYGSVKGEPDPYSDQRESENYVRQVQSSVQIFQRCARVAGISKLQIETGTITMSEQAFLPVDWLDNNSENWLMWSDVLKAVAKATGSIVYIWGDTMYVDSAVGHSKVCTPWDAEINDITIEAGTIPAVFYTYEGSWSGKNVSNNPVLDTKDLKNSHYARNLVKALSRGIGRVSAEYRRTDMFNPFPTWYNEGDWTNNIPGGNVPYICTEGDNRADLSIVAHDWKGSYSKWYFNHTRSGIQGNIGYYWSGKTDQSSNKQWTPVLVNYVRLLPIAWPVGMYLRPVKMKMFATYEDAPDDWNESEELGSVWKCNGTAISVVKQSIPNSNWIQCTLYFNNYSTQQSFDIVMNSQLVSSDIHIFVKEIEYADDITEPEKTVYGYNAGFASSISSEGNILRERFDVPYNAVVPTAQHESMISVMRDVYGANRRISKGDVYGVTPQPLRVAVLNGTPGTITGCSSNIQGGYSTLSVFNTPFKAVEYPWSFVSFSGVAVINAYPDSVSPSGGQVRLTVRITMNLQRNSSHGVETATFVGTVEQLKEQYNVLFTCNYILKVYDGQSLVSDPDEYCSLANNILEVYPAYQGQIDDVDFEIKAYVTDGTHRNDTDTITIRQRPYDE